MRLSSGVLSLAAFLVAGVAAFGAASVLVQVIEERSVTDVQTALQDDDLTWTSVDSNGLQLFLAGTAPDEAARFRAISAAGRVVDASRVIDQMEVVDPEGLTPPRFSIELLRNDAGVSLIGLVPASTDIDDLLSRIARRVSGEVPISEFLETADFPPPDGWNDALGFAVDALDDLPRSKISVTAEALQIKGTAESETERRTLETDLARRKPEGLRLALDISAPRPVITPFTLRFVMENGQPRFDACSADTDDARQRILQAAARAGLDGKADCRIGLGVPTLRWAEAADLAITALADLGGDSVTLTDTDISLIAREGTDPALFDRVVGTLENALPPVFALTAVLPAPPNPEAEGPPDFVATLSPEGEVQLRGRVNSAIFRDTAESFAQARFGSGNVNMSARVDETLPIAWSVRVLAGLEALGYLANGAVLVTPDDVSVSGNTGNANAREDIAALLAEKLGGGKSFDIAVTYVERLDPLLGIPTPDECEAQIVQIIGDRKITFEPGAATLDESAKDILDEVAELLVLCGDIPLEIQGHTDSQGREVMNQELSQARAEAVLDALRERRVITAGYSAVGYGEANPIADNGTEDGREANRRIEFKLIRSALPAPEDDSTPSETPVEDAAQTGQDTETPGGTASEQN